MPIAEIIAGAVKGIAGVGMDIANLASSNTQADRNYQLQKEQYEYMKSMQGQVWQREDTAVQRRVADLKAAGLSPVLAAGSAASSSSPINVTAPQRQMTQITPSSRDIQSYSDNYMSTLQQVLNLSQTKAATDAVNLQNEKERWNLDWAKKHKITTDAPGNVKLLENLSEVLFGTDSGDVMQGFDKEVKEGVEKTKTKVGEKMLNIPANDEQAADFLMRLYKRLKNPGERW